MRPLRLLLSLSTSLVAVTLLLYMVVGTSQNEEQERISVASSRGSFKAMFSSPFPSSLFPPSAIISLTDDNSTFFLARPAAFGPALPKGGLSGSLWIGSGFGDDSMGAGGELGCSDVPGWEDGNDDLMRASRPSGHSKGKSKDTTLDRSLPSKEGVPGLSEDNTKDAVADDGTDDHLQPGLPSTHILPRSKHADIQSLQESAEIAGKVVLLKRGGCGFLAKVQWAQSRGGVAVIVGDDVRGGALVRMYAKGDTSNITIPSLFTSHTTAHLLSSLYPGDGMLSDSAASHASVKDTESHATLSEAPQAAQTSAHGKQHSLPSKKKTAEGQRSSFWHSFLSAFFGHGLSNKSPKAGSRRLPNSGDLEWVEVSDWEDDQNPIKTKSPVPTTSPTKLADGFVIGEHDWRDPDLLPLTATTSASTKTASATPVSTKAGSNALPGSGEYTPAKAKTGVKSPWSWWSGSKHSTASSASSSRARTRSITSIIDVHSASIKTSSSATSAHQGLWVTLTPTNVSSSPFFDTLLVLVVSPLVTLTVVYALLLLRSRIRRRRWRAPKSVVERLPVRTYQTISDSSSAATSSAASPTTPLLQHSATRSRSPESRSRSTTVSETPATSTSVQHASRDREEEKRESGLAAWRRRYGGRQRECVVCLEEYVDGVSQVMSLPCGHEFHADCITPWLVTRRRTCPICKGDVVRSLSRSWHDRLQSASPTRSPRLSISEEDVQTEAAETRNMSPSASRPVPMSRSGPADPSPHDDDVEAGWSGDNSRRTSGEIPRGSEAGPSLRELASSVSTVVWRGVDAVRTTTGLQRRSPPEDVDRNR